MNDNMDVNGYCFEWGLSNLWALSGKLMIMPGRHYSLLLGEIGTVLNRYLNSMGAELCPIISNQTRPIMSRTAQGVENIIMS